MRCEALEKNMYACFLDDPPIPEFFYKEPYSIYRFQIDCRDSRLDQFDFRDNLLIGGAAMRTHDAGFICLYDGGLHQRFRSAHYKYLSGKRLHPIQFSELCALFFYDQTVLHEEARQVQYYWNEPLQAVVAQSRTPRNFDPYLHDNHDMDRLGAMLGYHLALDPKEILTQDGGRFTSLQRKDGSFLPHPVTEAESQSARKDPEIRFVRSNKPKKTKPK
jgi:hypothetical protein